MSKKSKQSNHFLKRHPNISMLLIFICAVLIYVISQKVGNFPEMQKVLTFISITAGFISILWFYFTKTRSGRDFFESFFGSFIHPSEEERQYWNLDGTPKGKNVSEELKHKEHKLPYLRIVIICFLIVVGIWTVMTLPSGVAGMSTTYNGMSNFMDGIISGDVGQTADGLKELTGELVTDLRNLLILAILILIVLLIALLVYRIYKHSRKDTFIDEDDEEE